MAHLLAQIEGAVITGQELYDYEAYFHDKSGLSYTIPEYLVFAHSRSDIEKVVEFCMEKKKKLSVVGGRTGYSGAANARGGVVVSLEKMNRVLDFFKEDAIIHVEAGIITDAITELSAGEGLMYPVKFAATGSSQIGGNIATNAGGVHVLRYGTTRAQVLSLEVVTGRGDVLNTGSAVLKDASGLSLKDLFIGSEGRLGIITRAYLRLVPIPRSLVCVLCALSCLAALAPLAKLARQKASLHALEFWDLACQKILEKKSSLRPLFNRDFAYYVLIEWEAESQEVQSVLEEALSCSLIEDALYAETALARKELWKYRERISESLSHGNKVFKYDISIPPFRLSDFLRNLQRNAPEIYPTLNMVVFGHLGDGNVHLNFLLDEKEKAIEHNSLDLWVYEQVIAAGGSLSAEHGLGQLKRSWYAKFFPQNFHFQQQVESIFDPHGILR
ncbi:MAG: FAD-binding oxidoreductase [Leptospiraceae bacterium]|nr:FAD-binding oxidoreductase [Leptospiraceae bacterium]MDW8306300.1 FAD-binding oxidoreductase [Leptospiraceae bacterium]